MCFRPQVVDTIVKGYRERGEEDVAALLLTETIDRFRQEGEAPKKKNVLDV